MLHAAPRGFPPPLDDVCGVGTRSAGRNQHGSVVKAENRINRQTIAQLERVIEDQQAELDELCEQLAEHANNGAARARWRD